MTERPETLMDLEAKLRSAVVTGHGKYFVMTPERIELLAQAPAEDRRRILAVYAEALRR